MTNDAPLNIMNGIILLLSFAQNAAENMFTTTDVIDGNCIFYIIIRFEFNGYQRDKDMHKTEFHIRIYHFNEPIRN